MYYIYIATNKNNTVLYTGVSNKLERRMFEHIMKNDPKSFAAKYNIKKLVYCDVFSSPIDAIAAEKKIKRWTRKKKIKLITDNNPKWKDLLEMEM